LGLYGLRGGEDFKVRKIVVLGGAGYVGSVLCPALLELGHTVVAYDRFWFGHDTLPEAVWKIQGDIRDINLLKRTLIGADAVIHLACISNDPSFDLEPELGESINWTCFPAICEAVKDAGISRFIYASSSSVYGVKDGVVTEDVSCKPLTDYSKFKLKCEEYLQEADMGKTIWSIIRPATVCGWSPRLRLDLVVNALTISALAENKITVHGGPQLRPNINIRDMANAYLAIFAASPDIVHRQVFNAGDNNHSLTSLAQCVQGALGLPKLAITHTETKDTRSYHINSSKISRILGFRPQFSITQAVKELAFHWGAGEMNDALTSSKYYNVRRIREVFNMRDAVASAVTGGPLITGDDLDQEMTNIEECFSQKEV
jgi:nucleoside-diphosphate-sugar epimerase